MSEDSGHAASFYVKTWAVLLVLFAISVLGPLAEVRWLTIITAFGIAGVKAYVVAAKFMHLDVERKYISYMFAGMIMMMVLLWGGIVVDIGGETGQNWERVEMPKQ